MYYSKLMTGNWHHFKYCKYLALFLVGIIISKMIYKASTIKAILQGLKITRWYFQEDVSLRQAHMYGSCSTVITFHWDLIISKMIYKASTIKAILQGLKITRWYFQEDVSLRQLSPFIQKSETYAINAAGQPITATTRVAVTLRWLAGGSSLGLCFAWGISRSAFYKSVYQLVTMQRCQNLRQLLVSTLMATWMALF
jgi:hypothetical protein